VTVERLRYRRLPYGWAAARVACVVLLVSFVGCNGAGPSNAAAPSHTADAGGTEQSAMEEQPVRMQCRFEETVDAPTEMRYDSRSVCLSRIRCWSYRDGPGEGLISAADRTFVVENPEMPGMTVTMDFEAVSAVVRLRRDGETRIHRGDCTLY